MKNLLVLFASIMAFSSAQAITCMSANKNQQMVKAKISGNRAVLTYEGEEYAQLFLREVKGGGGFDVPTIRTYKQIGEFANMITVKSGGLAGLTQAKLYQVSKGGTRLVMNMEICK